MTTDHEHSAAIDEAAAWLRSDSRERISRPIIPHLKQAFGLTAAEAIEAIREANLRRARPT
ncbi:MULTISPECIES: hypothetical protein [unclassified Mesorhizobium]|uniref:hypothetical protein n=1 Tax=unclassified Mesorhizobium TaxID=325217 RepID=UPI0003CF0A1A|nr:MULTISPECIES: hypothetical protein [unclassified Mesorhizobium]ESY32757.1 hypothetical protein X749_03680 [Mesorhizobium sp. LNJC391B00]